MIHPECHEGGRTDSLCAWDFGLGKRISTKRAWGEMAWSVAVSANSTPLVGVGKSQLPGRKVRYQVLRLRLILSESCRRQHIVSGGSDQVDFAAYIVHPWFETARRLGYSEFFNAKGLKKLETANDSDVGMTERREFRCS